MLYEEKFKKLVTICDSLQEPTIVLVEGNYGIGKSYLINQLIIQSNLPYMKIKHSGEGLMFQSLTDALDEFNQQNTLQLNFNSNLPYNINLKKELLEICTKSEKLIICIEDLKDINTSSETIDLIIDTINYLNNSNIKSKVLFLFENSIDKPNKNMATILYKVKQNTSVNIFLKAEYTEELENYFKNLFSLPIQMKKNDIERILKSCFFNPFFVYCVVEYLKENQFFYIEEGVYYSEKIDYELVATFLKQDILDRYNRLDHRLQEVLLKASFTGCTIDIGLLENPIKILEVEKQLKRIEVLTQLVKKESSDFEFENEEVHYIIENLSQDEEKIGWHQIIAESLLKKINTVDIETERTILYKVGLHYKKALELEKANSYLLQALLLSKDLNDYSAVIQISLIIEGISKVKPLSKIKQEVFIYQVAYAHQCLSNYKKAVIYYQDLVTHNKFHDLNYINFHLGSALYNVGETLEAKAILSLLKNELKDKPPYCNLFGETLILLSGICDQLGDKRQSERYYEWALNISKETDNSVLKNKIFRCSSMFYSSESAIPLLEESYHFFSKSHNLIEHGFIAHNLAMGYMYQYDKKYFKDILKMLNTSKNLFQSIGSNDSCFSLNGLGIFYALTEHNYEKALEYFSEGLNFAFDDYIKINFLYNLSQVYRLEGNHIKSNEFLGKASSYLVDDAKDMDVLKRNINFGIAMNYYEEKNFSETVKYLEKAFYYEVDRLSYSRHDTLLAKLILQISSMAGLFVDEKYQRYNQSWISNHQNRLLETKTMWGTLLFWGV